MLQWIVEPVVGISQNVRFSIAGILGESVTVGNIFAIQDVRDPVVSRLRITSDPSLPTADVVCLSGGNNVTRPYSNVMFSKLHKHI